MEKTFHLENEIKAKLKKKKKKAIRQSNEIINWKVVWTLGKGLYESDL